MPMLHPRREIAWAQVRTTFDFLRQVGGPRILRVDFARRLLPLMRSCIGPRSHLIEIA
jgi:hypothetical protein